MAFNPFNVFRRNQKTLFAIITVFVMFTFVLSFGRGDFFDWLPRWLGSKRAGGDVLAVIDGSKLYESEVSRTQRTRTLANQYMSEAAARAGLNLSKYIADGLSRVSAENRRLMETVLTMRQTGYVSQQLQQRAQFAQFGLGPPVTMEDVLADREQTAAGLQAALARVVAAPNPKENDQDIAKAAQSLIDLDVRLFAASRPGQYFVNQPNQSTKDAVEFALWLKKADKLGIHFTDADVSDLVNREFFRRLTNDDYKAVEDSLRGKQGFAPDVLHQALADEFRVRAAQAAVLGGEYLHPFGREYDAPYDYYQFYRDQTTAARYGLIEVPAENYLSQVQGQPTESELRDIFRKHRNDEPNPALARPGLKEPRKLKLEWLEATGTEPYYQKAADEGLLKAGVMARAGGFLYLASSLGGVTTAGLFFGAPAPAAIQDPVLDAKYEEYKRHERDVARDNWYATPSVFGQPQVLDRGFLRPENAGAVAGAAGPAGQAYEADRKARLRTLPAGLIAPVSPTLGAVEVMLANAAVQAQATRPLPLDAVRAKLSKQALEDAGRTIAHADLNKFDEEMAKFNVTKAESDAAGQARTYLEKFVKERGLTTGQSQQFRDLYTIANDPGLKPLKDKMDEAHKSPFQTQVGYVDPAQFGARFFFERDPADFRGGRMQPATGLYKPQPYPSTFLSGPTKDEPAFLVWRVAEQAAEVPRDFNTPEVKAKAEAAWRRMKARELAKQAAEDLAKRCQDLGANFIQIEQKLRDLRAEFANKFPTPEAKDRVKYFELDDVAQIVSRPLPMAGQDQVAPFQVTPSADIPYPGPKMADELVQGRDKPLSSSMVLVDNPEDRYYVAVLEDRRERSADEFGLTVYGPSAQFGGGLGPVIDRRHQDELRKQARDRAIAMLKAEFKYEEKSDKVNKTTDSSEE